MKHPFAATTAAAVLACLFLAIGGAAAQSGGTGIVGNWLGTLAPSPTVNLRLAVTLTEGGDGTLSGTFKSIDQGSPDIPLDSVTYVDGTLLMKATAIGMEIEGSLNPDTDTLDCRFNQRGAEFPLVLSRIDTATALNRPQIPVKPYPYIEEDVTFLNEAADVTLAGTLTLPRTGGPFPAVILLTGSGQQNRDEEIMNHKPFLVLADYLTRRGIAVLRCDDRGIGGSTGDYAASTTEDFAGDALTGVAFLKGREEIDPGRIGFIGHSEGGTVAPIAANRSTDVAFLVLMAAPGQQFVEIVISQQSRAYRNAGMGEDMIALRGTWNRKLHGIAGSDLDDSAAMEAILSAFAALPAKDKQLLGFTAEQLEQEAPTLLRPWWRYYMGLDVAGILRQVTCPVLALNGGKDTQVVAADNLPLIENTLRDGGNPDYTVRKMPGLNHLFQTAETGSETEYAAIEETISPEALKIIGDWVAAR